MDTIHTWLSLYMPSDNEAFHQADLSVDRSRELKAVEREGYQDRISCLKISKTELPAFQVGT